METKIPRYLAAVLWTPSKKWCCKWLFYAKVSLWAKDTGERWKRRGWTSVTKRSQGMFNTQLGILVEAGLTSHPTHAWEERRCHLLHNSYRLPTTLSLKFRLLYIFKHLNILRCCSSSSFRFSQSLATVDTMYFVTMMNNITKTISSIY